MIKKKVLTYSLSGDYTEADMPNDEIAMKIFEYFLIEGYSFCDDVRVVNNSHLPEVNEARVSFDS